MGEDLRSVLTRVAFVALGTFGVLGCEHTLETTCVPGEAGNDCEDYQPVQAVADLGACLETCDVGTASTETGDYPCEVQAIIDDICTNCHVEPIADAGVPFPLAAYTDSQQVNGSLVVYAKIVNAVGLEADPVDFMPLGGPALDAEQRKALLDDWACVCAPPRAEGETCE